MVGALNQLCCATEKERERQKECPSCNVIIGLLLDGPSKTNQFKVKNSKKTDLALFISSDFLEVILWFLDYQYQLAGIIRELHTVMENPY